MKSKIRQIINGIAIRFFNKERINNGSNTVYYHLQKNRFYLRNPEGKAYEFVEITRWANKSQKDGLWVNLRRGDKHIILDSKQIRELAIHLDFLEMLDDKYWEKK